MAEAPFCGNPATVVFLDKAESDEHMQRIAAELNQNVTAFILPEGGTPHEQAA